MGNNVNYMRTQRKSSDVEAGLFKLPPTKLLHAIFPSSSLPMLRHYTLKRTEKNSIPTAVIHINLKKELYTTFIHII